MQKRLLFLVVGLAVLALSTTIGACARSQTPLPSTATPTTPPSQTAALPTATLPGPTATQIAPTDTVASVEVPAGCSTYTLLPTPDPAAVEAFPNNQAGDWSQGLDTASLTIVEYSDFQ